MTHTNKNLTPNEQLEFDQATHLFATNEQVSLHNKKMLKDLNVPIALCTVVNSHHRLD